MGHSHAGGYRSFETRNGVGDNGWNCLASALGQDIGILAAQEKHELFAAKAVGQSVRAALDGAGYSFEHRISNRMPVYVIDRFEVIEVDDSQCGEAFRPTLCELSLDRPPIEQSSQ